MVLLDGPMDEAKKWVWEVTSCRVSLLGMFEFEICDFGVRRCCLGWRLVHRGGCLLVLILLLFVMVLVCSVVFCRWLYSVVVLSVMYSAGVLEYIYNSAGLKHMQKIMQSPTHDTFKFKSSTYFHTEYNLQFYRVYSCSWQYMCILSWTEWNHDNIKTDSTRFFCLLYPKKLIPANSARMA